MKKLILLTFLILISFVTCHKDDDSSTKNRNNLLALYLVDQTSGNCAVITKLTNYFMGGAIYYWATGYAVPKGGCNEATLGPEYTTDKNIAKQKSDAYYDAIISVYKNAGSSCDAPKAYFEGIKTSITADSIANQASSSSTGCTPVIYGKITYCKDQTSVDIDKNKTRYVTIGSVKEAMKSSYEAAVTALKALNTGFTDANIALLQPLGPEELKVLSSAEYSAYSSFYSPPACAKAIADKNKNPGLYSFLLKTLGKLFDPDADVSKIIPVFYISCGYGSGFTENQSMKKCDQAFEEF